MGLGNTWIALEGLDTLTVGPNLTTRLKELGYTEEVGELFGFKVCVDPRLVGDTWYLSNGRIGK